MTLARLVGEAKTGVLQSIEGWELLKASCSCPPITVTNLGLRVSPTSKQHGKLEN